jgi:cAMP phosphodiesterase
MKIRLLPTTIDQRGVATTQQHFSCFLIDENVAIDAGSLATATSRHQKKLIKDIVLTHAHLDHIAGLPIFIDDLFVTLSEPLRVHALDETIKTLEEHIFNWKIYPRFSELRNKYGRIIDYRPLEPEIEFSVSHLDMIAIEVNHKVPSIGLLINDGKSKIAITGDTTTTERFWQIINTNQDLSAVLIECAFPNELYEIAENSYHLTPQTLTKELKKLKHDCPVYAINLKPMYHEIITEELRQIKDRHIEVLEIGRDYEF